MKNKVINKICILTLALVMALAILPVTALADGERVVKVTLPDTLQLVEGSGALEQDLTNGTEFQNIVIEPKSGNVLTTYGLAILNNALSGSNLRASLDGVDDTGKYTDKAKSSGTLTISLASGKSSSDVQSVTINADKFTVSKTSIMYGTTSVVGQTGDANKMNATYSNETGKLEFDCKNTGPVEFYNANNEKSYYIYGSGFTRFYIEVLKGESEDNLTLISGFNLGDGSGSSAPDTTYASSSTTNPYVNLKIYVGGNAKLNDSDMVWVKVSPCYPNEKVYDNECYFYIKAGTVESIKTSTVSVTLPEGLKQADGSGDLTQTLTGGQGFKTILLELQSGYAFTSNIFGKLNKVLANSNVIATPFDEKTISIEKEAQGLVYGATVSATDFDLTQTYIMYNDKFSKVGQTGENNKMNAKYDNSTGKLTFNCDRTGSLEYYNEQSERLDYTNFSRFYVTVYTSDENGSIEDGSKLVEFNLGDSSSDATKPDTNYASSTTVNPYINLKKVIQEKGSKLSSSSLVWVKVRACTGAAMIDRGNVFFKIRVGTVEDILKEPSSDSSSKKSSGGWDDGGPFTTDTCGNVFDRWGNKIYEAKGCNVGGYNLVRTSVED